MGWVYGFHSLDPGIIGELSSAPAADLVARLGRKGISPEEVGCESWDDGIDENQALTLLATTRTWDVDKDLDAIEAITALNQSLGPVRKLLDEMQDFAASALPGRFHPAEVGLMGIAMPEAIALALSAVEPFTGAEGRRVLSGPSSWLQRMVPGGVRKRVAADDHLWRHWNDLVEALKWSHSHGEWLGLHMS